MVLSNHTALACSLTEEGYVIFQSLCPTGKLESDCTCNVGGVYVDVLGFYSFIFSLDFVFVVILITCLAILFVKRNRVKIFLKLRNNL